MDFYKYFTLFGKTYHITIISEDSNDRVFTETTESLLKHRKLLATKMMKDNFDISLKDAKKIVDNIVQVNADYVNNTFSYEFLIKGRAEIKTYLKNTLGQYKRKNKK